MVKRDEGVNKPTSFTIGLCHSSPFTCQLPLSNPQYGFIGVIFIKYINLDYLA